VGLGQEAATGKGMDRAREAAVLQHEDDIDRGKAGA
jgi:hypothetical protein